VLSSSLVATGKPPLAAGALLLAVAAALVLAHAGALAGMVGVWSRSPMYSYAYTVPFISAYLLWSQRAVFRGLQPAGSWRHGLPVLGLGLAMLAASGIGGVQVLGQLAFLVNLTGAVLLLLGPRYVRAGWAGLAYLLLMIPLWDAVTEPLHEPFQHRSAAIGIALVRLIGIPAYRQGTFISLPNLDIEVARACSGVNYLVAVVALGLPLSYLCLRSPWRRLALVGSAMVVAALSNGLRVALISVLAYYEIGSPLHGPFHVLHGLFVAGIGYVALFAGLRWLSRGERRPATVVESSAAGAPFRVSLGAAAAVAAAFAVAAAAPMLRVAAPAVTLAAPLDAVPLSLDRWTGEPLALRQMAALPWSGADQQLYRRYVDPEGAAFDVYVGYFETQRQSRELAGERSAELHRGSRRMTLSRPDRRRVTVNVIERGTPRPRVALFWYDVDGATETERYATVLRTAWNSLVRRRSNGAVVMVSGEGSAAADPSALERIADLAGRVHAAVDEVLRPAAAVPSRSASRLQ
jgi:EpsI family protein